MIRWLLCAAVLAALSLPEIQAQKTAKPAGAGVENAVALAGLSGSLHKFTNVLFGLGRQG